jgi:hypothetical protein
MSDIMNDFVETNSYQIPGKGEFTEIAEPEPDEDDESET